MDLKEKALQKHYEWQGKIEVVFPRPAQYKGGSFAGVHAGRCAGEPGGRGG